MPVHARARFGRWNRWLGSRQARRAERLSSAQLRHALRRAAPPPLRCGSGGRRRVGALTGGSWSGGIRLSGLGVPHTSLFDGSKRSPLRDQELHTGCLRHAQVSNKPQIIGSALGYPWGMEDSTPSSVLVSRQATCEGGRPWRTAEQTRHRARAGGKRAMGSGTHRKRRALRSHHHLRHKRPRAPQSKMMAVTGPTSHRSGDGVGS